MHVCDLWLFVVVGLLVFCAPCYPDAYLIVCCLHDSFFFYNCCVVRQILISILLTLRRRRHYTIWTLGKMDKAVWTQKAVVREAGFLAVGEACEAIFWPAPGRRERTFDRFLLSTEGTFNFCVLRVSFLHLHPSLNREGRWGTTGDVTASFLQFSLFSTALWDLANSRPVPFPGSVFPPLPLSALSSSAFHCASQNGLGHTWWTSALQLASLYHGQEVFVWSDCLQYGGKHTQKNNNYPSEDYSLWYGSERSALSHHNYPAPLN